MKIYISGKISGLPFPEVKVKFQEMQDFLEDLNFEVINPTKNGLTESHTWEQHIARDVELLLPCDAIYMFDGWQDSVGSCIVNHNFRELAQKVDNILNRANNEA